MQAGTRLTPVVVTGTLREKCHPVRFQSSTGGSSSLQPDEAAGAAASGAAAAATAIFAAATQRSAATAVQMLEPVTPLPAEGAHLMLAIHHKDSSTVSRLLRNVGVVPTFYIATEDPDFRTTLRQGARFQWNCRCKSTRFGQNAGASAC
ncbi:hypothetical protein, conserved [Eimeria tenella]|uniref:Uncharacterized protein n=1 Tax=Eimeria tenella TaxID=5802 RepID=U6KGC7_EIMTE|nr:hypothetical protein, conserved [Eimeria tenella]CDJ37095.1 hypothetical protein, conserved [Eimeria tenella]|eukprot:XP_013227933.1 hypothetical protein, conserved [Eimeria tenella]